MASHQKWSGQSVKGALGNGVGHDVFLPAAGQGIVGFETRTGDADSAAAALAITHELSMIQCRAEREFLRLLDGGCHTPVGVSSLIEASRLIMSARVFDEESDEPPKEATVEGLAGEPEKVAAELYALVL